MPANPPAFPFGQGAEILVHMAHQFLGGKIDPIASQTGIAVKTTFVEGVLAGNNQDKRPNFSCIDALIQNHFHVGTDAIRAHETMQVIDDRVTLIALLVLRREVNGDSAIWVFATGVLEGFGWDDLGDDFASLSLNLEIEES